MPALLWNNRKKKILYGGHEYLKNTIFIFVPNGGYISQNWKYIRSLCFAVDAVNGYHHHFSHHYMMNWIQAELKHCSTTSRRRRKTTLLKKKHGKRIFFVHKSLRKWFTIYYLLSNSNGAMHVSREFQYI